jgi:hypothetical protein
LRLRGGCAEIDFGEVGGTVEETCSINAHRTSLKANAIQDRSV